MVLKLGGQSRCLPNGSRWLEQFGFSSGIPSGLELYDCSFLVGPSTPASTISLLHMG